MQGGRWDAVDDMCGSSDNLISIGKRCGCLSKECECNFSDMAMFSFNGAILVMSVWANEAVHNALRLEILGEGAKFTPPSQTERIDRHTHLEFYHSLKL